MSCKSQIIPLENQEVYLETNGEIPAGAYVKDVNNILPPFEGNWNGNINGKTYEFQISKITENRLDASFDVLTVHYKVLDNNGNVLVNTMGLPDSSPYVIKGSYLDINNGIIVYILNYLGYQFECGQSGDLFLTYKNPSSIVMAYAPDNEAVLESECTGTFTPIFPSHPISITKQ